MSNYEADVKVRITGMGDLDKLEQRLGEVKNVPIKIDVKSSGIKELLTELKAVQSAAKSIGNIKIGTSGGGGSSQLDKTVTQIAKIKSELSSSKIDLNMSNATASLSKFGDTTTKTLEKAKKTYSQLQKDLVNFKLAPNDNIATEYYDKVTNGLKKFENQMKIAKNEATDMGASLSSSSKQFNTLDAVTASNKTLTWLNNNTKAAKDYGEALKIVAAKQKNATNTHELADANKEYRNIVSTATLAGKTGNSFGSEFKRAAAQIGQFVGVYGMFQQGVQVARQMASAVIDVDSAMTELSKVSDAPSSQITSYFDQATESAKKYGAMISDVILSTSDWSRLGYDLKDSAILSDATTLLQKVGDNMTQESSSEGLISILKGFNKEADDVGNIIDVVNEVANKEPIDTAGIVSALQRSASSLSAAGNDMNQSIAMITAANSVVQDPESVGTAYKTMSMRIRGAKTDLESAGLETDGMAESTAKLQEELLALSNVNIMKDKNTFKSTYDILDGLADKWESFSDIQQASITELIAGKRQGNVMSALMSNWDIAEETLEVAKNSDGSAEKELGNYQKSIQYSLDKFKAQFQETSTSVIDSDIFKGAIDGATGLLDILTQITGLGNGAGLAGILSAGVGIAAFKKNLD